MNFKQPTSLLLAAILAGASFGYAQSLRFSDVYISVGTNWGRSADGTLADFRMLAPTSDLLQHNFDGYTSSGDPYYYNYHSGGAASFLVGIDFKNKETGTFSGSPQLRIGLTYSSGIGLSYDVWKDTHTPYDTLTSAKTGNEFYIDSVHSQNYNMTYATENLMLDLSLIFRTNPAARWSLYGGMGLAAGLSFNACTSISSYQYASFSGYDNHYERYPYDEYNGEHEYESFKNKNTFLLTGYIPLGIDLRIGNKREFWKRVHLFYEIRPALNYSRIPELGHYIQGSVQQGFGIRIT